VAPKVIWLFVFVALYWAYCIFWGIKCAQMAKTATDYFISGRQISMWVFVLAATATSFSGWTFMGHPGLVYRDGFQYAYASFYAITIPFTGVMFLKRQWMLGKRFGYVTPGEMLADYFRGDAIRILTVIVALLFSIPYLGLQLRASGFLFNVLTDNLIPVETGMWVLSAVVLIYVASGGLRAVAYVDTLQCILLALGIVITGFIALNAAGGFEAMNQGFAKLGASGVGKWKTTPEGYNAYFAIPGVIQWTAGLGKETPVGGLWTGVMVLTYMFALMGIHSAPAFTMWSFANNDPKPFATQQVWASSFGIGFILFFFTAFQGMGAHLLGANGAVTAETGMLASILPDLTANKQGGLVPHYFNTIGESSPWLVGLLAVCALAAMQSTGAAYMSTAGGMLTRDLYKRYLNPDASHATQKLFGRMGVLFIVLAALVVATFTKDALVLLGGLAVAFGFQMWPSLASVTWFPWLTRQGVTWGLAAGLIGVIFSENFGGAIAGFVGIELPWGRWPLTMHSAFWGMLLNLGVCLPVSMMTQDDTETAHRMKYHDFLREHASLSPEKKGLVPVAWAITLLWFFFGVGPGAVIGNDIFGAPNAGYAAWTFGMPSIWAWQILFWALGVFMMWFLAFKMEMSTLPDKEVEALTEDIGDTQASSG
jgi:solute:Na+ symporter, SSS family